MRKIQNLISDLNIRWKLIILNSLFLVSIIILGSVVNLMLKASQTMSIIISEDRYFVENFAYGKEFFLRYEISGNEDDLTHSLEHFNKAIDIAYYFSVTDSVLANMPEEDWKPFLFEIFKEGVNYKMSKLELMAAQINLFHKINPGKLKEIQKVAGDASVLVNKIVDEIQIYELDKSQEKRVVIESLFDTMPKFTLQFSETFDSLNNYVSRLLFFLIAFLVVFLGTLVTIISFVLSSTITKPVNILAEDFKRMANGDLKSSIIIDSENEIGILSKAFYEIRGGLQNIVFHAKKIAQGDYTARLQPFSDKDELSHSLNLMAEKLEESSIHLEHESWVQKGLNGLDDQMRGNHTVRELSDKILIYLGRFLGVEMGAVYVFDEVLEHLELAATLGLNTIEVQQIVKPGDGLIGSVLNSYECQVLDVKDKLLKTFSASGEVYPEKLYLIPLHTDGIIQAVIELATLKELSQIKMDFLMLVKERISVNVNAAVARFRNKELLDKSLEQAEVLKARDEELVQKLEENKLISESLSRETALLNSMMQTLPDYIYFKDIESRFIRISESLASLFSVKSIDEVVGKTDFDYFPRKEAKQYYDEEQKIITKGEGIVDEVRKIVDEEGEELWTSVTKLPMFDDNGVCIGTFGISKDVTTIKKLEIELNLQNDKLKQNQEELKATNEELHAQEEELRVANEELAEQTKILVESEKNLQVQQEELQVVNEELETKSSILEQQKNQILKNNKNLEKARQELERKAKELELASQYKSEFLANMSHELRTPLNSMLILSKLLGDNKNKNLSDDQLKSVSIIYNSGKDLLELINEILDLSKIEAGKMNFDFTDVYSSEIVEEIKANFTPVAENKNLKLTIQKSDNFPNSIYTDRQRLMQVVKNLLSNAFKFTSKGGITVKLGIPNKDVQLTTPKLNKKNTCFIAVEDTGVGIPQGKVDAIFEAFQQADGSISRKFGGTGLGLSISKQIVQVFGGEIHVSSTEGVGSEFRVYLPIDKILVGNELVKEQKGKIEKEPETFDEKKFANQVVKSDESVSIKLPVFVEDDRESTSERIMVLIIHSERKKAEMLVDFCHKKKFKVLVAANITDGIALANKVPPQAIILSAELNVPEELSKLKENKLTAKVPLHVVSRIEDFLLENIDGLQTPETKDFQIGIKNIENKMGNEFNQVLVVEDDLATRIAIHKLFEDKNIIIHEAKTGSQAYEMIAMQQFDCVILDLGLPDFSGAELLDRLKKDKIPIPYIIINTARELSDKELRNLQQYSESIVIKGVKSDERLLDEVTLFLHQVSSTLPESKKKNHVEEDDNNGFKGKSVLVVDDDIRNVFAMAQILEERGIEILEAENGKVAIDVLKNNENIDLVLMDVMMPVMNGYDAMKIIRNTTGIENIPIIILTAKAMKEDFQKAIDFGANDFISKPVDIDKLISLLKIWLFK